MEKEDVPIDDISCLVVELFPVKQLEEQELKKISTQTNLFFFRDALRASFVEQKSI